MREGFLQAAMNQFVVKNEGSFFLFCYELIVNGGTKTLSRFR